MSAHNETKFRIGTAVCVTALDMNKLVEIVGIVIGIVDARYVVTFYDYKTQRFSAGNFDESALKMAYAKTEEVND